MSIETILSAHMHAHARTHARTHTHINRQQRLEMEEDIWWGGDWKEKVVREEDMVGWGLEGKGGEG